MIDWTAVAAPVMAAAALVSVTVQGWSHRAFRRQTRSVQVREEAVRDAQLWGVAGVPERGIVAIPGYGARIEVLERWRAHVTHRVETLDELVHDSMLDEPD